MHSRLITILALSTFVATNHSVALEVADTMTLWKRASTEEKGKLVAAILKRDGRKNGAAALIKCLDEASGVPGHADLRIVEVAKACEDNGSEPV